MIRFQCSNCDKKLGIADSEAGKSVKCPQCGTKVLIPGPAKTKPPAAAKPPPKPRPKREEEELETEEIDSLGGKEEFVDAEPVDEPRRKPARRPRKKEEDKSEVLEEEEAPRRSKAKKKSRRQEEEDEDEEPEDEDDFDDEEKGLFSPNRLRGLVALLVAGCVLAFALLFPNLQEEAYAVHKWIGCGLAGVIFLAGIFYLIKG